MHLIVVLFCEICVCELFNSQQQENLDFVRLCQKVAGIAVETLVGGEGQLVLMASLQLW